MYDVPSSLKQLNFVPETNKQAFNSNVNEKKHENNERKNLGADLDTLKGFGKKEKKILLKRLMNLKKKFNL
jgi:hypothetical protein